MRKAGLLIGSYEIPNHFNIYFFRENFAPVLRWPLVWYTLALPFGVLGLVAGLRRGRRSRLAAACLLAIAATVLLFFVTSRYRLPLLIWLLPFAGYGLTLLVTALRERRWRLIGFLLALLLATGALMHLPLVRAKDFHDDWETLAFYWGRQGDWDRAAFYNQQALRENMRSAAAWQNLGYAYTQRGRDLADWDRAEECFYKAIELDPTLAHAYGNLAFVYFTWDRPELFAACLDRALLLDPALARDPGRDGPLPGRQAEWLARAGRAAAQRHPRAPGGGSQRSLVDDGGGPHPGHPPGGLRGQPADTERDSHGDAGRGLRAHRSRVDAAPAHRAGRALCAAVEPAPAG